MIYQLRNKHTGKMFAGSYWSSDATAGKCYNTLGKLRAAITRIIKDRSSSQPQASDYEVVEYDIVNVKDIHEVVTQKRLLELLSK
jgi:hypothetical protein